MNAEHRHKALVTKVLPVVLAGLTLSLVLVLLLVPGFSENPQVEPQTAAGRGRLLAEAQGCTACHSLTGERGIGPSWQGSFGSTRRLRDGSSVVVNEAYLYSAMREPAAQLVDGFENVMLPVALSDAQIADIIALIRELDPSTP